MGQSLEPSQEEKFGNKMKNCIGELRYENIAPVSTEILMQVGYEFWSRTVNYIKFPIYLTVREGIRRSVRDEILEAVHGREE